MMMSIKVAGQTANAQTKTDWLGKERNKKIIFSQHTNKIGSKRNAKEKKERKKWNRRHTQTQNKREIERDRWTFV